MFYRIQVISIRDYVFKFLNCNPIIAHMSVNNISKEVAQLHNLLYIGK